MKFNHFIWEDRYSVGVKTMDDEHKELIVFINKMFESMEGDDYFKMQKAFEALAKYVIKHFSDEEALMDKYGFEGRETHKLTHKKLLVSMGEYEAQIKAGKLDKDRLHGFLKVWLSSHIMGIDQKYGVVIAPKTRVA